jgi:non-specific serine/threonine protein kinase
MCFQLRDHRWPLTSGRRGGVTRHRTLNAAVDWSFHLCTALERTVWARSSVFADGFDLAAAQAVCSGEGIAVSAVFELVASLVDKSILISEEYHGKRRFRLLETLRQYGRDRLRDLGEEAAARRRHRDYYLSVAEQSASDWFGPDQPGVFDRTRREIANLRVALDFCLRQEGEATVGLRLANELFFYWLGCGNLSEGRHWLDRALAADVRPSRERAKALWAVGTIADAACDVAFARKSLEECRAEAESVGDGPTLARAIHQLGCSEVVGGGDAHTAVELCEEAHRRFKDQRMMDSNVLMAYVELAVCLMFAGDLDRATELCEDARAIAEEHGEQWACAYAFQALGMIALRRGDPAQAAMHARSCLRRKQHFNDLLGFTFAIELLAWSATADSTSARPATRGREIAEHATLLLGAADQIWRTVGATMMKSAHFGAPHKQCLTVLRKTLGDVAFNTVFHRGGQFSLDETLAYALGESPEHTKPSRDRRNPARWKPLTRREQQVADLIAEGATNRDIAERLVISQRTAESHVEHIMQKLGFTSRAHVITWTYANRAEH